MNTVLVGLGAFGRLRDSGKNREAVYVFTRNAASGTTALRGVCVMSDIALVGPSFRRSGRSSEQAPGRSAEDRSAEQGGAGRLSDGGETRPGLRIAAEEAGRCSEPVRWTRIREIRTAINAGAYLTGERLDAAVDGLLRDLEA